MHILAPHISCVVLPHELEEAIAQEYKQIYIITSKGFLKHHVLRGENRFVRVKVASIPGYTEPKIEQGMNFLPAGKIPYELFEQVQAFFIKVMEVKTAELEAMIHILYNPEQGYHLGVPPQRISKAAVSYDWNYVPAGTSIVVDIHSHNTMGAFFSGTDDRDDRNNISFSGVFGKLKDRTPATIWRFNYLDMKFEASVEDLFEAPTRPEVEVPAEWMDNVEVVTYTAPKYNGGTYSGQGNGQRFPSPHPGVGNKPVIGKSPAELAQDAKWRYPTNQTQSPAANRAANLEGGNQRTTNFPRHSGPDGRPTGNDFSIGSHNEFDGFGSFGEAEDALSHFFAHPDGGLGYGVPTPGIPTQSETMMDDDVPFAFGDTTNKFPDNHPNRCFVVDDEPADPNFGVTHLSEGLDGEEEAEPVGKSSGELALSEELSDSQYDISTDPEYQAIQSIHGTDVADVWWDIANGMSTLDGIDELNQELICDMMGLTTPEGQLKVFRELFTRLPAEARAHIETHGL